MTERGAILLVAMEPPSNLEEEFNDWYDTEHYPQRCALPGFVSGARWVCLEGWPRWVALYDLASLDSLLTPEYKAVSQENSTPWSKRILPRTRGRKRLTYDCIHRQQNKNFSASSMSALVLIWVDHADISALQKDLSGMFDGFCAGYRLRLGHTIETHNQILIIFESASTIEAKEAMQAMQTTRHGVVNRTNYCVRYHR